jgi:O-antigen/teichoic acid export membrane protein
VLLSNLLLFVVFATTIVAGLTCGVLAALGEAGPAGVEGTELVLLGLGALAIAFAEACYAFLLGCSWFRRQAVVQATVPWIYAGLVAVMAWGPGLTIARAALVWTIAMSTGASLLFFACVRGAGLGRPDFALLAESVRFGLRAWAGSFSSFLNFRADQVVMGFIAAEATLGIYAVAVNAGEALLYLPTATALALLPVIARSSDSVRVERTLFVFRILALITIPAMAVAALVGPELLPLFFGTAYEDSVAPFLWLLPGTIGFAALALFTSSLMATSAPGLASLPQVVALVTGLALDFALIPPFGASGAAAAASSAFLAGGLAGVMAYKARTRFAWRETLPRRTDLQSLRVLAAQLPRPLGK